MGRGVCVKKITRLLFVGVTDPFISTLPGTVNTRYRYWLWLCTKQNVSAPTYCTGVKVLSRWSMTACCYRGSLCIHRSWSPSGSLSLSSTCTHQQPYRRTWSVISHPCFLKLTHPFQWPWRPVACGPSWGYRGHFWRCYRWPGRIFRTLPRRLSRLIHHSSRFDHLV